MNYITHVGLNIGTLTQIDASCMRTAVVNVKLQTKITVNAITQLGGELSTDLGTSSVMGIIKENRDSFVNKKIIFMPKYCFNMYWFMKTELISPF